MLNYQRVIFSAQLLVVNCYELLLVAESNFLFFLVPVMLSQCRKVLIGHVGQKVGYTPGPWTIHGPNGRWGSCLNEVPATGNFKAKTNKEPTLAIKPAKVRISSRKKNYSTGVSELTLQNLPLHDVSVYGSPGGTHVPNILRF